MLDYAVTASTIASMKNRALRELKALTTTCLAVLGAGGWAWKSSTDLQSRWEDAERDKKRNP